MNLQNRKALKALIVVLAVILGQVYVSAALPEPAPPVPVPQQLTARLTTKNNQPITVNGASSTTGATILTGATIETPDQVGATIDLGDAGVVEVGPNSVIKIDFDENGNVRVKVVRGCAMTNKTKNILPGEMEVYTDVDSVKTEGAKKDHAGGCILPNGTLGSFGGGISSLAVGGIVGAGIGTAVVIGVTRGGETSPSSPGSQN